jgi:hypothetical protein
MHFPVFRWRFCRMGSHMHCPFEHPSYSQWHVRPSFDLWWSSQSESAWQKSVDKAEVCTVVEIDSNTGKMQYSIIVRNKLVDSCRKKFWILTNWVAETILRLNLSKNICNTESAYCYGRHCVSCVSVRDVCESHPEFLTEDLSVWCKICFIHLVNRHTKPDNKFHHLHFPFPVPNVEGVWKNLKMAYSATDISAVWRARAIRFLLLDGVCEAEHSANIGFFKSGYSPVLQKHKSVKNVQNMHGFINI